MIPGSLASSSPGGDLYWNSVVMLLHMDGVSGSSTFTDQKAHTVTASGGAALSNTKSVFGGTSGKFNSDGDYVSSPSSSDFDFGSGDFTIEGWVYPTNLGGDNCLAERWLTGDAPNCAWILKLLSTGSLQFVYNASQTLTASTTTISANQWSHFAFSKSGTSMRYCINGNTESFTLSTGTINNSTASLYIGKDVTNNSDQFYGYMDDFRITKGVARYTANFGVQYYPFQDG